MKIISFFNQKGGVGKTTSVINIAAGLGRAKKKVLILDMDPQGNSSSGLGFPKNKDEAMIYHALVGEVSLKDLIKPTKEDNVSIVTSNSHLSGAELALNQREEGEYSLKKALEEVDDYDFILIDCPPSLGILSINALVASDTVLIPIQAEYYALEGLSELVETIYLIQESLNPHLEIEGILMTMYDRRNNLARDVEQEIKDHFKGLVFNSRIPRNVRLAEAPSFGRSIFKHERLSKGAFAYQKVVKELLN